MIDYINVINTPSRQIKDISGKMKSFDVDVLPPRECYENAAFITDRNMGIRQLADGVMEDCMTDRDVKDSEILRIVLKMLQKC